MQRSVLLEGGHFEMTVGSSGVVGRIIDIHTHIASAEYFPRHFMSGIFDNMMCALHAQGRDISRDKVERLYLSRFQDPDCDQLVAQMDAAGIEQSALLLADFTFAVPEGGMTIAEMLGKHIKVAQRHPGRFLVFAGIDPRWGRDGLQLLETAAACAQVSGFKVYPPCGFTPSDKALYPFYEICSKYHLPVVVHIGATSPALDFEPARPIYLDQAARDFPNVNFILAHGSVHYPQECAMMCSHRPNIYLDVSGYETASKQSLKWTFGQGIGHKVLFGTDWPLFRLKGTQKDFVQSLVENEDIIPSTSPTKDMELFFFGNATRILRRNQLDAHVA